jgi:hypothetical protein
LFLVQLLHLLQELTRLTLRQELRSHPTAVTTVTNDNGKHAMTSTRVPTPRPASTSEKDKHVDDGFATGLVLARRLGVSGKTVSELGKAGIAVRSGRGLYELEESVRRYCEPHPPHSLADDGESFLRTSDSSHPVTHGLPTWRSQW